MLEACEILYPAGFALVRGIPQGGLWPAALRPASVAYGVASRELRKHRMKQRLPLPVSARLISIGNLEVGGSGKTPLAIHLLGELEKRARRPVYVSRGFGSEAERMGTVTVMVPSGAEPARFPEGSVRLVSPETRGLCSIIGDEGAVVSARCPRVPLVFSADRRAAIRAACSAFDASHVILDDAFQTWGLARDLDLVLLDAERPAGNGRLLPAGTLREGVEALGRADAVGFNGIAGEGDLERLREWLLDSARIERPVFGMVRKLSLVDANGRPCEMRNGAAAALLSGIGRPSNLERALAESGIDLRLSLRYPDHFRYGERELRVVREILERKRVEWLITTEKDWVKIRENSGAWPAASIARLDLEIVGEDPAAMCEEPRR